jgi:uncharacterized protein (DUF488 family)
VTLPVLFTVGHSTRTSAELIEVLRDAGVVRVADVRRYPASRRQPRFDRTALEALAQGGPTAILCAERAWWKCHRRLLSDLWVVRGGAVVHLAAPGRSSEHELSEWARPSAQGVTYPALL